MVEPPDVFATVCAAVDVSTAVFGETVLIWEDVEKSVVLASVVVGDAVRFAALVGVTTEVVEESVLVLEVEVEESFILATVLADAINVCAFDESKVVVEETLLVLEAVLE